MPTGDSTGVTGDPHFVRLDGTGFDFTGEPWQAYNFLTMAGLSIHAAFAPVGSESYVHRLEYTLPAGAVLVIDEKGLVRVTAAGFLLDVWRDTPTDGPLAGTPHLNLYVLAMPTDLSSATGLLATGTAQSDQTAFMVTPPPAH